MDEIKENPDEYGWLVEGVEGGEPVWLSVSVNIIGGQEILYQLYDLQGKPMRKT
ncbi:MAG: hypothetical protein KJ900_12815 [Proteobacteria bacterium]|nr:hypothetical protein [Pseudomonadota bacterium]MCG2745383.1 hypothetical protein [Desulfobacteraceae bacterium]MBU3984294.1 hypothetical protein [Pseudomonadota bacterium]MBU4027864.1 hypothetical protein [Pseudomonadota bacterium]MBU4043759.1 hypothetical protein [Pseudomonadota bacterium]